MNNTDKKKFAELMVIMGENFQKEVSKPLMRAYWMVLEKYDYPTVEAGIFNLMATRTITGTLPVVAEIIAAIENRNGSTADKAELAWLALVWAIEHIGHWRSVSFADPVIHDVVQALGGWLKIQNADNPEWNTEAQLQWRRKEFLNLYRIMAGQRRTVPYLVGEQEASNSGRYDGFVPRIVHVGGQPGQYITTETERPKELPELNDCSEVNNVVRLVMR